ncbi:hypothetical protein BJY01DRAFT_249015 [Aspergillus pseudoustus]|uniref:Zn(2)-C6 fungal-type domain-containing protein n=1 Tax=Aspergillus pseudoustus TaxID=1810923 RepID=A0ABR4JR78_9EURO
MAAPKRSVQACSRCRQQKMKCSGDGPPCERCARFGRECVFEPANTTTFVSSHQQQQHQPPLTPSDGSLPLDRREQRHRRKRSLDALSTADSGRTTRPPPPSQQAGLLPSAETPYSSVQELETNRQLWPGGYRTPSESQSAGERGGRRGPDSSDASLLPCLAEAGITLSDAQELFRLFGERLSPFIPSFYATDFGTLPTEPVYVLAAIYAVARYLPDSDALRDRIYRILHRLLSDLILQPAPDQSITAMLEKMQGLVVLYACCEATGPIPDRQSGARFDMLSVKGIVEAYLVKLKIRVDRALDKFSGDKLLPSIWVVWLYTMSHHCAVIHGCPRTLSASTELLRAKAALEKDDHPRIHLLLGECELCLLWERVLASPESSPQTVAEAMDRWKGEWQDFLSGAAAQGRHLYFHYFFTRFHILTHLPTETGELYVAVGESLDAAQDFLGWIKSLSPISKDRLRYLCDFAFVLMAYVCLYILRTLQSGAVLPESQKRFLEMVHDVAAMMRSLGTRADTRPAIYGHALVAMCKQSTQINYLPTGPALVVQGGGDMSDLPRPTPINMDLSMVPDGPMDDDEMLRQSRLSPSFWTIDPDLSVFNGIMAGIPVPEEIGQHDNGRASGSMQEIRPMLC